MPMTGDLKKKKILKLLITTKQDEVMAVFKYLSRKKYE